MKNLQLPKIAVALLSTALFVACSSDDDTGNTTSNDTSNNNLELNLSGLGDLGDDYEYEGWLIVDGSPVSTGRFDVNSSGELSKTMFSVNQMDIDSATKFVLSIEPTVDNDPTPSNVKVLAGDFTNNMADVKISDAAALGTSFTGVGGKFLLATPTDDISDNDSTGVWFLDNSTGTKQPGLTNLPALPSGWKYEGWAVIDGTPVSTGTFTTASGADDNSIHNGTNAVPPFPGEDFLNNAPSGLTFPTNLAGQKIVVSIEPSPDNSTAPFFLKPLAQDVPTDAKSGLYSMTNIAASTYASGTVTKK